MMWRELYGRFFRQQPAFLPSLGVLLGFALAFSWHMFLLMPLLVLTGLLLYDHPLNLERYNKKWLGFIFCVALACLYVRVAYTFPDLGDNGLDGKASVKISSISSMRGYRGNMLIYRGKIKSFIPQASTASIAKNIPFTIYQSPQKRAFADATYEISGKLKKRRGNNYLLKPDKGSDWQLVKKHVGLSEWRFKQKKKVSARLKGVIKQKQAVTFLTGLATAEFSDKLMRFTFNRFGLSHILAISGFHFAIICLVLNFLLRLFLSPKCRSLSLFFLLSVYFIFIGFSPSIQRAWLMITIFLLGIVMERSGRPINSLSIALLFVLLLDPLMCLNIGFQFSFLVTFAILLLYAPIDNRLGLVWTKYIWFRKAISLGLSVHLAAIPLTLYHFHVFYLLGFIMNLIIPMAITISLIFLVLGFIIGVISPMTESCIHQLNGWYTQKVLDFIYCVPTSLDYKWVYPNFSLGALMVYFCLFFLGGIYVKERKLFFKDIMFHLH